MLNLHEILKGTTTYNVVVKMCLSHSLKVKLLHCAVCVNSDKYSKTSLSKLSLTFFVSTGCLLNLCR